MSIKNSRYTAIMAEIATLNTQVKEIFDQAGDEALDKDTYQTVVTNNKKIEELEIEAKEILDQQAAREAAQRRALAQDHRDTDPPRDGREPPAGTLGDRVLSDRQFQDWLKQIAPAGRVPDRARVQSPGVQVGSMKTLITGDSVTSGGALVVPDRLTIIDPGTSRRPLVIRDLITTGRTSSDTVEYVREGAHTNAAAAVAEATATSGGSGVKPESAMVLAIVTENVKTIAHWVPATRRALADAGQLRTLIDSFLRYGLEEELEDQILNGDGTGENFTGIYQTANTSTQAWDTDLLTTTRKARTKVLTQGRAVPSAYVFHPTDWEKIDLLQDNEARYYFGGPSALGTPRLWGLPVVESEANTAGAALVGDFRLAALWDREQTQILVSDSHSDFFIRRSCIAA